MSLTNIRRQLGPVRKRVNDYINEINITLEKDEKHRFFELRTKLVAAIKYHEAILEKLSNYDAANEDEEETLQKELTHCTNLSMDANEAREILDEKIDEVDKRAAMSFVKQQEKLDREIEKLKVETEFTRQKMEHFNNDEKKNGQQVRLPKIELPHFDGNITSWTSFWDSFNSLIHSNEKLAKIDKFNYLIACLKGGAKDYMKGFSLSNAQYDEAITYIKERYDDREFIIHHHYDILSDLNRSKNTTEELRCTINKIETNLRSLQSLGEDVETRQLVSLIKSKFPAEFTLKLEETRPDEWTVAELRKRVNKLITAREKSSITNSELLQEDQTHSYAGEGLLNKDIKTIRCIFCSKSHWSDECQKYKAIDERKNQIKGKCFNCFSSKHK